MKFPNAAKGVKKIYTAELLSLIGTVIGFVGAVFALVTVLSSGFSPDELKAGGVSLSRLAGSLLVAGGAWIVMGLLLIIAMIIKVLGIAQARKDEDSFTGALFFQIISIATTVLTIALPFLSMTASGFLDSVTTLLDVFVLLLVVSGIIKLSDKLNNGEIARKGVKVLKLVILVNVLSLVGTMVMSFMGGILFSQIASSIGIAVSVLNAIQYIMYLSFLSKAKKMLQKS